MKAGRPNRHYLFHDLVKLNWHIQELDNLRMEYEAVWRATGGAPSEEAASVLARIARRFHKIVDDKVLGPLGLVVELDSALRTAQEGGANDEEVLEAFRSVL